MATMRLTCLWVDLTRPFMLSTRLRRVAIMFRNVDACQIATSKPSFPRGSLTRLSMLKTRFFGDKREEYLNKTLCGQCGGRFTTCSFTQFMNLGVDISQGCDRLRLIPIGKRLYMFKNDR